MKKISCLFLLLNLFPLLTYATSGSLDGNFNIGTGANSQVRDIVVQPDDKILIAGQFSMYDDVSRPRIARLNSDGSLDFSFDPVSGANGAISSVAVLPDGKILIGGQFSQYNGVERVGVARLHPNGRLDSTFVPTGGINRQLTALAPLSDGKVIIAFSEFRIGQTVHHVMRLNQDGSEDNTFFTGTGTNAGYTRVLVQPDGKILVTGSFTSFNGVTRQRIMRLNQDGTLDTTFDTSSGAADAVWALALQSDGKVLIGGTFTSYAGNPINRVARINTNGSFDASFNPGTGANGQVFAMAVQEDGKILTGGLFNQFNSTPMNFLVRKNPDGSIDNTFNIGTGGNQSIRAIAFPTPYHILIGGDFTSWNGVSINRFAKLIADESDDPCAFIDCPPGFQCFMGTCIEWVQTVTVEGIVTDNTTGNPLSGVSVKSVYSSEHNTVTNQQGYYQLAVEKNAVIKFELQGYHHEEVTVGEVDLAINMVLWSFDDDACYGVNCPFGYVCNGGGCFLMCGWGRSVKGYVTNVITGLPLANVQVIHGDESHVCFDDNIINQTDVSGFHNTPGRYSYADRLNQTIRFSLDGYHPQLFEVPEGEGDYELNVELVPIDPCEEVTCPFGYVCIDGGCFITCGGGDVLIKGYIKDAQTGLSIDGVKVLNGDDDICYEGSYQLTDRNGYFESLGSYSRDYTLRRLTFIRNGYETRELFFSGDNVGTLNVLLDRLEDELCAGLECPDGYDCYFGMCFPLPQTITIEGQITHSTTGEAVTGVTVQSVYPYLFSTTSDASGNYKIDVEKGAKIIFEKDGFCSQEVSVEDVDLLLNISLMDIGDACCGVNCPFGYVCNGGGCFLMCGGGTTVTGYVTDANTGLPLANIQVIQGEEDHICFEDISINYTDASGFYRTIGSTSTGPSIRFSLDGYHPQMFEVPEGEIHYELNVAMVPVDPCQGVTCPYGYVCIEGGCFLTCGDGVLISGYVTDTETGLPLAGVRVIHGEFDHVCYAGDYLTDASGYYSGRGMMADYIIFSKQGYETIEIFIGNQAGVLNVSMNRLPDLCDDVICGPEYICVDGGCFFFGCTYDFDCPEGYICNQGICVEGTGPCADVICREGEVCFLGTCFMLLNTVTIKGQVSSPDGSPIPRVAVISEGDFYLQTTTDSNGNYSIEAEQSATLRFSRAGYYSKEIAIGEFPGILNVQLDIKDLCEDVVCPFGYVCRDGGCFLMCGWGRSVKGYVTNVITGLPLANVQVIQGEEDHICFEDISINYTDASGFYRTIGSISTGPSIRFSLDGYHPQMFEVSEGGGDYELNVALVPIDPCEGVTCPLGYDCIDGGCFIDACFQTECPIGMECFNGFCLDIYTIEASVFPEGSGTVSGAGTYFHGDMVTLKANPGEGYRFLSWTRDDRIISTDTELGFVAEEDMNVTAHFETHLYQVYLETSPANNLGGIATGAGMYSMGSEVTVAALPNIDYTFSRWIENGVPVSTNATYTFTINSRRHLVAEFAGATYTINVSAKPSETGQVTGGGTYYQGDIVSLQTSPAQGYYFLRWMEGNNQVSVRNPYLFTASADRNLTAEFAPEWWNDDNSNKSERVLISSIAQPLNLGVILGQGYYQAGETVVLQAIPNQGAEFVGWLENGQLLLNQNQQIAGPVLEFTATGNRYIQALFFARQYQVVVDANPVNAGITTVSKNGFFYGGDFATVTAMSNNGYRFINWTQGTNQISARSSLGFTVNEDTNLTATFSPINNFNLTLGVFPPASGFVNGGGNYSEGTVVSISALAATGYKFSYWHIGPELISRNADTLITLNSNLQLEAYFDLLSFTISATASQGGSISPEGETTLFYGSSQEYIFSPEPGYRIADVIVNGQSVGVVSSYRFENILEDQTLYVFFEEETTLINNLTERHLKIFPNPAKTYIRIELSHPGTDRIEISLFNIHGQLVRRSLLNGQEESDVVMSLDGLNPGIYQLHFSGNNIRITRKIVINP